MNSPSPVGATKWSADLGAHAEQENSCARVISFNMQDRVINISSAHDGYYPVHFLGRAPQQTASEMRTELKQGS